MATILELVTVLVVYSLFFMQLNEPIHGTSNISFISKKSTMAFFTTGFLLIIRVFRFANFGPFRESGFKNYKFLACIFACLTMLIACFLGYLYRINWIYEYFEFTELATNELYILMYYIIVSTITTLLPYKSVVKFFYEE